jgi:hypothetical protein
MGITGFGPSGVSVRFGENGHRGGSREVSRILVIGYRDSGIFPDSFSTKLAFDSFCLFIVSFFGWSLMHIGGMHFYFDCLFLK